MERLIQTLILTVLCTSLHAQSLVSPLIKKKEGKWVDSVYSGMTLEEKLTQLIHIRAFSNKDEAYSDSLVKYVEKYQIGGVTFFQGGPVRQAILTNKLQQASKVPLMISIDGEWGLGMRLDSTMRFPYQMTLGAIQNDEMLYDMGIEIARQCRELGIHVNFAPVVDVNNNPANPVINFRSFGENKYNVSRKGVAYMKGLQDGNVLATAKHFPGHGDTGTDSHYELPVIDHPWERIDSLELYPFKELIDNGVAGFMIAHLSIPTLDATPNQPSTLSKPIVTGLLRDSLGFQGMTFTDALEMQAIAKYYEPGEVEREAFIAGNDAMLLPLDIDKSIEVMKKALEAGMIKSSDLEFRVKRALLMKYRLGLKENAEVDVKGLVERLNTGKGDLMMRELFKASLTVLKNDSLLPIRDLANSKIASLSIGPDSLTIFQKTLGLYTKMDHYTLPYEASGDATLDIASKLEAYDIIILGMHDNSRFPRNRQIYSDAVLSLYEDLANRESSLISVLFRNPYTLDKLPAYDEVESLVVTYQDAPYSQEYAAQLVFGAFGASGTLPVSIEGIAKEGEGLKIAGLGRFEYTVPEAVGFDRVSFYAKVDSIVNLGLDSGAYPGGQILMAKDGKVFLHKAFGYQTYDKRYPVEIGDLYDFASITRPETLASWFRRIGCSEVMTKTQLIGTLGLNNLIEAQQRYTRKHSVCLLIHAQVLKKPPGPVAFYPNHWVSLTSDIKLDGHLLSTTASRNAKVPAMLKGLKFSVHTWGYNKLLQLKPELFLEYYHGFVSAKW